MKINIKSAFWKKEGQELRDGINKMLDLFFVFFGLGIVSLSFQSNLGIYINLVGMLYIIIMKVSYNKYEKGE